MSYSQNKTNYMLVLNLPSTTAFLLLQTEIIKGKGPYQAIQCLVPLSTFLAGFIANKCHG